MSADIRIVPAKPAQAAELSAMLKAAWHATYDAIMGKDAVAAITARWHAPDVLARQMDDDDSLCLVAEDPSGIVGNAYVRPAEDGTVELSRLYVLPQYQGRGLGSALLEAAARQYPNNIMRLEVQQQNTQALAFYQTQGFVITGKSHHCGGDSDVPSFIMERGGG